MVLNKFLINVLSRVTLIVGTCMALGIVLQHIDRGYYYTLTGLLFLIALQTWLLVIQVNKTNTDFEKFLSAVQDHDSSIIFPSAPGESFRNLYNRMNEVNTILQQAKIENERTSQYLQTIVDHVDTGLLSFDANGRIEICNRMAKKYLANRQIRNLSSLKTEDEELVAIIHAIKPGQEVLHKLKSDPLLPQILIKAVELRFENRQVKLVSFQDITLELDKKELDSWQRLIRVLTHEMMNSISPITSLASVISGYFKEKDLPVPPDKINHKTIAKTLSGLNTIEETGKGLLHFVEKYRSLTSLPKPNVCQFNLDGLFLRCKLLMESGVSPNIKIFASLEPEDLALIADYAQVEQVLINLIKNAAEALSDKKNGTIQLRAFHEDGAVMISVEDNGPGIPADMVEDIFVPFFTTKENGSGIGLSLSKQIMQNHGGTISVNLNQGNGAKITLRFS